MDKRLYRSRTDNKIAGVCGGMGEYFGIDPTFVRIAMVLLIFADGIGILAYIISWIGMPQRPLVLEGETEPEKVSYSSFNVFLPGIILVAVGLIFLLNNVWWWFDFGDLWPIILIALGALLIFGSFPRDRVKNNGVNTGSVQ